MISARLWLLNKLLPLVLRTPLAVIKRPTPRLRKLEAYLAGILPGRTPDECEEIVLHHKDHQVPALQVAVENAREDAVLLYLHGGAYMMGTPLTYKKLAAKLANDLGINAVLPKYRLAPEHSYPAAIDDATCAYEALLAQGFRQIVIAGDSAGGGLSLALLGRITARNRTAPALLVALSPWVDLTAQSESLERNKKQEVSLPVSRIEQAAEWYAGDTPRDHPEISPLFARFNAHTPVLIQVSDAEALEDDTHRMAARLREFGCEVVVQTWHKTPHVWQIYFGFLPEARDAIAAIRAFVLSRIAASTPPQNH